MTSTTRPRPNHSRQTPASTALGPPVAMAHSGGANITSSDSAMTIGV